MRLLAKYLASGIFFVLLGGCVILHGYPETWEPTQPVTDNQCPPLNGAYLNRGDVTGYAKYVLLSDLLFKPQKREPEPEKVALELSGNDLIVRLINGENSDVRLLSKERGEFHCDSAGLHLSAKWQTVTEKPGGLIDADLITLTRTENFLVAKIVGAGAGVVVLPVAVYLRDYARFPLAK